MYNNFKLVPDYKKMLIETLFLNNKFTNRFIREFRPKIVVEKLITRTESQSLRYLRNHNNVNHVITWEQCPLIKGD